MDLKKTEAALVAMLALLLAAQALEAQPAFLVEDIQQAQSPGEALSAAVLRRSVWTATLGSVLYFSGDDGSHGSELWRTDGTANGTWMVRDLCPGRCRGFQEFSEIVAAGASLYFVGEDGVHGRELWRSDGTAAGTQFVLDLVPGPGSGRPQWLTAVGPDLFFVATDPVAGPSLWKSLPEGVGAMLVKDIHPSSDDLFPDTLSDLVHLGGELLLFADDGISGLELWRSDGTMAGTDLLKDINPGSASGCGSSQSFSVRHQLVVSAGVLFFPAEDGIHGRELWTTDGTAAGTQMAGDLVPGPEGSAPRRLCATPTGVYFGALTGPFPFQRELWKSDGTPANTSWVAPVGIRASCAYVGGRLLYDGDTAAEGAELWTSDGTEAGTTIVKDIQPGPEGSLTWNFGINFGTVGTKVIVWAADTGHGMEPWISDGTEGGTFLLADIAPGPESSTVSPGWNLSVPQEVGGVTFFHAFSLAAGWEPWSTDGTPAGTSMIEIDSQYSSDLSHPFLATRAPSLLAQLGSGLLFAANDGVHGRELWHSAGPGAGAELVRDLFTFDQGFTYILPQLEHLGKLYSVGPDGRTYVSDGTLDGTVPLLDSLPDQALGVAASFTPGDSEVFFANAGRLWKTGGAPASTVPLTAGSPAVFELAAALKGVSFSGGGSVLGTSDGATTATLHSFQSLASLPGPLGLFAANEGTGGTELWRTDFTADGTELVLDIQPGPGSSSPEFGVQLGDNGPELFVAADGVHGRELWISDGTTAGTMLLQDIRPGPVGSDPTTFVYVPAARKAFFLADDGVHGREVWVTDGSEAGTALIADLSPGSTSSYPTSLTATSGLLFFVANDDTHGVELWRTDGTATGTFLVEDIASGAAHSLPEELKVLDGLLLFSAWEPNHGREPWVSNGLAGGTVPLQDIAPGPISSSPAEFTIAGPSVFFFASDGVRGFEPWALPRAVLASTLSASLYFHSLPPCRLLDTRPGGDLPDSLSAAGNCGIPKGAKAIAANVTVVASTAGGELVAYPANLAPPATAVVVFPPGTTRAGNAIIALATDGSGAIGLLARLTVPGSLQVLLDVAGYFE